MKSNKLNVYNILGGEWIYYKIYIGTKQADDLLKKQIFELAKKLLSNKTIDSWFFIRYNDPSFHIRIRFKLYNESDLFEIVSEMYNVLNPLVRDFSIWKVQLDTYNREIERYGKETMELSEKIFFYDSMMVLDFLNRFKDENLRWLFSLKAIDSFLDIFEYSIEEKILLMQFLAAAFKKEYEVSQTFNTSLNNKYRLVRAEITEFMESNEDSSLIDILDKKAEMIQVNHPNFIIFLKNNLEIDLKEFLSSHIHMTMNRIFRSKNRDHEMICYDFLSRYYKSKIAITKYKN